MSIRTKFWTKYCAITLIAGTALGLMGYKNMKTTPFEILSNDIQISEAHATASIKK